MDKPIVRFLLYTVGLYLLWFGSYEFYLKPAGQIDHLISENISIITCYLFNLSDNQCYYTIGKKMGETYLFFGDNVLPTVRIGSACNGLEMIMIFSIFILCYPGNIWIKLLYTAGGILLIHVLNIFRNYVLTLLTLNHSPYFELFHRYIFIFLIYGVIFLLWIGWTNTFSKLHSKIG
jgi:exosortase family protein XrtF